jgi:hypothetical protein
MPPSSPGSASDDPNKSLAALAVETPRSRWLNLLASIFLGLLLIGEVCALSKGYVYDEPLHLTNVMLLKQEGFSKIFLRGTKFSAPGPLYPMYHFMLGPVTKLSPLGIRLANLACLAVMLWILARILAQREAAFGRSAKADAFRCAAIALGFLTVPPAWIVSGLALTEVPSLTAILCGIWLWLKSRSASSWSRRWWIFSLTAGIALGLGSWGRSVLVVIAAVVVLVNLCERPWLEVLPLAIPAALLPAILFAVWGGLTPPGQRQLVDGLTLEPLVLCFSYCGVFLFFILPSWFGDLNRVSLAIAAGAGLLNFAFGWFTRHPYIGISYRDLIPGAEQFVDRLAGSLLVVLGCCYATWVVREIWKAWFGKNLVNVCLGVTALLLSLTPMTIAHRWNIRYAVPVVPFMLVLAAPRIKLNWLRIMIIGVGGVLGFCFLRSYFDIQEIEARPIVITW